jgi:hypothetical protein
MRRPAAVIAICVVAWSQAARAQDALPPPLVQASPGAEQIQFAAHEHDLGYRAYLDRRYDEAATHFENAFFAAPNPAELRSAIRARREAGQLARAATLASIGQRKFPGDAATERFAAEVLAEARPRLVEVRILSPGECTVAVDEKIVATEKFKDFTLFLNPGKHELLVSWSEGRNTRIPVDGTAGASQTFQLEPPPAAAVALPPGPPAALPPAPSPPQPAPPQTGGQTASGTRPFGPAVFVAGGALTAVLVGVTVWSGVDTINNPGTDAVRRDCANPNCAEYQHGLDSQLRTNVLLAATGGVAAATALAGVFFTQWSPVKRTPVTVQPVVGLGQIAVRGAF